MLLVDSSKCKDLRFLLPLDAVRKTSLSTATSYHTLHDPKPHLEPGKTPDEMPEGASIIIDRLSHRESLRPHRPTFDSQISPHAKKGPSLSHLFFRFRALRTGSAGTASSTSSAYLLHRCFPPRMGKMTSDKQEVHHNNWKCSLRWIREKECRLPVKSFISFIPTSPTRI